MKKTIPGMWIIWMDWKWLGAASTSLWVHWKIEKMELIKFEKKKKLIFPQNNSPIAKTIVSTSINEKTATSAP